MTSIPPKRPTEFDWLDCVLIAAMVAFIALYLVRLADSAPYF